MLALQYKPNAAAVVERLRLLYRRQAADRIFATCSVPSATLAEFARQYPAGRCEYPTPESRIAFWDRLFAERTKLEDDSLPGAYLSEMDQGLYGGMLGGEVEFMADPVSGWISSMVAPLLKEWGEFERLATSCALRVRSETQPTGKVTSETQPAWFQRYLRQLDVFVRGAAGRFGISHFILIDSLNFVFELVGATETYASLLDRPDVVRRAVDLAFDLNVLVQQTFFDRVGLAAGGTVSNMVQWIPGRIVSESVDPFHMTSVAYFEEWGRKPVERILSRFDGGVVHIHGNGRHLLQAVATIHGLKAIYLGDDRGFPKAFDVLPELQTRTGDMPLVVSVGYEDFVTRLDRRELPGGVLYQISGVLSIDTANRLMERVRAYRL